MTMAGLKVALKLACFL